MRSVVDEQVLISRAYLSRVCEPGSRAVWTFVRDAGPVEAARAIRRGTAPDAVTAEAAARRLSADPGADLDAAERRGARLVVPESDEWPHFAFGALSRAAVQAGVDPTIGESLVPPVALWVCGNADLRTLATRSVGVVGSRAATAYGMHVAAELSFGLASQGVAIVSGGAYGIDAAAHRAAIAANGVTVIVSAGGVDRPYPPSNASIFERALENGAVISESPPGCAPHRGRFLIRNRLIAALSTGVVVVEAAARSGARNTAGHARDLGRPLMAVPGPVTSAMSVGCHDLLTSPSHRALLVTGWQDVLAVVGAVGEVLPSTGYEPHPAGDVRDELDLLDPASRRVFDGMLRRRFLGPAEISMRSGMALPQVLRALPGLELADLIEAGPSGFRVARRLREPAAPA
ncbi:DNA-processing protein DprA [Jatrophihabitans sp.]|uniref:DNA-processing protein DprA n=1 Tax=Jatrophihabitans sp. TaxID=1932789 RepID=UPI0030C7359C|nr:processing protein [Jatrophihabitans sp.]